MYFGIWLISIILASIIQIKNCRKFIETVGDIHSTFACMVLCCTPIINTAFIIWQCYKNFEKMNINVFQGVKRFFKENYLSFKTFWKL